MKFTSMLLTFLLTTTIISSGAFASAEDYLKDVPSASEIRSELEAVEKEQEDAAIEAKRKLGEVIRPQFFKALAGAFENINSNRDWIVTINSQNIVFNTFQKGKIVLFLGDHSRLTERQLVIFGILYEATIEASKTLLSKGYNIGTCGEFDAHYTFSAIES